MAWSTRSLVAVSAALAVAGSVAGCSASTPVSDVTYQGHASVVLGSGVLHGRRWTLSASENVDEGLCLLVNDNAPPDAELSGGSCGFGKETAADLRQTAIRTDFDEITADGTGSELVFGPAPAGTTRIVISAEPSMPAQPAPNSSALNIPACTRSTPAHLIVTAVHPLPRWAGRGVWFTTTAPVNGCGYLSATFYNRAGRVIPKITF